MDAVIQNTKLKEKLDSLQEKPTLSVVTKDLIKFTTDTDDPLLSKDKKVKNSNPYKKKKGI